MRTKIIAFLSLVATSFGGVAVIPEWQPWVWPQHVRRFDAPPSVLFNGPVITPPVTDCSYRWRW